MIGYVYEQRDVWMDGCMDGVGVDQVLLRIRARTVVYRDRWAGHHIVLSVKGTVDRKGRKERGPFVHQEVFWTILLGSFGALNE